MTKQGNVQDSVKVLAENLETIKYHPMCEQLQVTPSHYVVTFVRGYEINGLRVSKGMGKIKATQLLIEKMEKYYSEPMIYSGY